MDFILTDEQLAIRDAVNDLCKQYPESYWIERHARSEYPEAFVDALGKAGWLALLIPEEYGGGGGSLTDAALVLETINRSGGSGVPAHAQMYTMGTILRHGSEEQKRWLLPRIATNEIRLQAFGVTEPDAGSETTRIRTFAKREGDHYVVNGGKVWTSRYQHSDFMLLLVRTTRYEEVARPTDGLSVLLVDLREAGDAIEVRPIRTMTSHETNQLTISNLRVPVANRIGEEGMGFRYILSGLNAERILVASESLGDGFWFIDKAVAYANERVVFGRPIGANQGVQFPLAKAYADLEAASLMRYKAAALFDAGKQPGFEANAAKLLASQATWAAANAAMDTHGGYGLAEEFGIERKFREARLPMVAPVNNNLILAYIGNKVLGLPKSY
ncbi:acyl-CoA dehydrogenase family protein [Planosporangium mesophilum]|uniref:Acyl-CoA dehydrogenase n=1 Tax=Planosporangium mesophilum TaxID=689768 RepID=A0A8J3TE19_9ACTN|nr:acyl-CoA dehydrogenase family protein [Planosporangium mesophilum]NJC82953.1 acyl-CoA/acyl-ACP dehydrogenase [Planosporangium mesophilum]GII24733.1 acyl-CoA dehydrogenase [Planosporangium mesophilum]